jgi:hypothetical protein
MATRRARGCDLAVPTTLEASSQCSGICGERGSNPRLRPAKVLSPLRNQPVDTVCCELLEPKRRLVCTDPSTYQTPLPPT